ncbi:MAG: HAMP domain-containing histidine kinase, partial [Muribaculaceae bacterium]
ICGFHATNLTLFSKFMHRVFGLSRKSDTLRISLASILRMGLEFDDDNSHPAQQKLDSIFLAEIRRNGLNANVAFIIDGDNKPSASDGLWKTDYRISPDSQSKFDVYVSPMYKDVLSHMWGIVLPFLILTVAFIFLSVYLTGIIKNLRTLEQMKDDFTHNMTHELKTPVAVAYSAADSMLRYYDQSDETRNKQFLKIILQRLGFLSGMIENILSMSMERFKTMKLNIENVALKPIVEEMAEMIGLKAGKPVKIYVDIPDELSVMADPLHLGNVLSNLMDNAVKYSGDSVDINIKADGDSIVVADNGIGIDSANLPFIFDKFYRVHSGGIYEVGGYGLGLFYVRQIVECLAGA